MASMGNPDSARRSSHDLDQAENILSSSEPQFARYSTKAELEPIHGRLSRLEWILFGIIILMLLQMIGVTIDLLNLRLAYYKHAKNDQTAMHHRVGKLDEEIRNLRFAAEIRKDIDNLNNEQRTTNCLLHNLAEVVKKLITDITCEQKMLTNSVEDLEEILKELKAFLHRIGKSTTDVISNQKILTILIQNIEKELRELKALYQNEKIIAEFQHLKEEVHNLKALSQDDADPNMIDKPKATQKLSQNEEELQRILQLLEQRKQRLNINRTPSTNN